MKPRKVMRLTSDNKTILVPADKVNHCLPKSFCGKRYTLKHKNKFQSYNTIKPSSGSGRFHIPTRLVTDPEVSELKLEFSEPLTSAEINSFYASVQKSQQLHDRFNKTMEDLNHYVL